MQIQPLSSLKTVAKNGDLGGRWWYKFAQKVSRLSEFHWSENVAYQFKNKRMLKLIVWYNILHIYTTVQTFDDPTQEYNQWSRFVLKITANTLCYITLISKSRNKSISRHIYR